jgi:hypothetical protein
MDVGADFVVSAAGDIRVEFTAGSSLVTMTASVDSGLDRDIPV